MNKKKTLFDFFTRSPATNSPSNKSVNQSDTAEKSSEISTPKSSKHARSEDAPVKNGRTPSSFAKSLTKSPITPLSSEKSNSTNKSKTQKGKRKAHSESDVSAKNNSKPASVDSDVFGSEDDENEVKTPPSKNVKRRRIVIASESEDSDEYKPDEKSDSSESESEHYSSESESGTPKRKKTKTAKITTPSLHSFNKPKKSLNGSIFTTPTVEISPKHTPNSTPLSKQKSLKSNDCTENQSAKEDSVKEYLHEKLEWLQPNKLRDKSGKLASDPMYNHHTLFVPESFLNKTTPAMRQWWVLKSDNFDTVLFFKVGKFYELYHMDAAIGVKELGLIFMKGDFAHSGFPEVAFGRYSESLIEKGYKVARVEQTESPQMMADRCKNMSHPSKYDKVVAREICQIITKGTRTLTYQEENMGTGHNYLLALCEKRIVGTETCAEYGVCLIDTSIGKFSFGQFKDDRHRSRLLTLIALHPIVEILYDKTSLKKKTLQLLNRNLSGIRKEALSSSSQFWESSKVLKFMGKSGYFNSENGEIEYPKTILNMLDTDDRLLQTPLKAYELAFRSLGACIWYLKECRIEDCLLSMKLFEEYAPPDEVQTVPNKSSIDFKKHMVLDGVTLQNLEIVPVSPSDNADGTLLGTMDHCSTSFGKRLFRNWLCSPLCHPQAISDRLDAIDDLANAPELVKSTTNLLANLPDLDRLLSKIHTFGFSRSPNHPDTRATFYDSENYNKRKITDFLSTLHGFKTAAEIVSLFEPHSSDFKSTLLKRCTTASKQSGHFPDMVESLDYFDHAFDHQMAKNKGNIIPGPGVDEEYDSAARDMEEALNELDSYLSIQKSALNCKVSYVHSGKNRYLLEIPDSKKVPSGFEFQGGRKGFKRYYTKEVKELLGELTNAEECRNAALQDVTRKIFADFDKNYELWKTAVHCIATLDVLTSLTVFYQKSADMCRPVFSLPDNEEPYMEIIDGKHPIFLTYSTGDDYIPNSVYIGPKRDEVENINQGGKVVLVTGPNMGGKSTLMRQAGTLLIMAHLGSYVPATSMSLTPVDRIFTRVGANDYISKGESTFFVEASETSCILHHATSNSFVLVDELGRGTATYDGTAIAYAALKYLANDIQCRTLFSTHYHNLVDDFKDHSNVGFGHMACMVEKDNNCPSLEKITFLYKFINGACPKSYGFNCALLAGVSKNIVHEGFLKAQQVENSTKVLKVLRKLLTTKKPEDIICELSKRLNLNLSV